MHVSSPEQGRAEANWFVDIQKEYFQMAFSGGSGFSSHALVMGAWSWRGVLRLAVSGSLCIALTSVALLPSPAEPLGEILQSVPHFPPVGEHQSLLNGLLPPGTAALQAEWGIVSIQHGSASQLCAAKAVATPVPNTAPSAC